MTAPSPKLAFVMVGLCGGYTTFSAFSLQTLDLVREGRLAAALWNIGLSLALCLAAVLAGHALAALLEAKRVKRVPVMRDGKVVGIISRANIVRAVGATKGTSPLSGEDDDRSVRVQLIAELGREEWANSVWPEDVIVRDGVVHYWLSDDEPAEKREALRVAAETIAGVRSVQEHIMPAAYFPAF